MDVGKILGKEKNLQPMLSKKIKHLESLPTPYVQTQETDSILL